MKYLVLAILGLTLVGCSENVPAKKKKAVKFNPLKYETYRPKDVLLKVGTNVLKKADLEGLVDVRARTILLAVESEDAQKRVKGQKRKVNRDALTTEMLASAETSFHSEVAFLTWARTNDVALTESDLAETRQTFLKANGAETTDYDAFASKIFSKSEREALERRFVVEALGAKARRTYLKTHPIRLSSNDVARTIANLTDYNRNAVMTNAQVWARATNLWNQAKSGADFAKLAEENTQDDASSEGGEWGDFSYQDLEQDGLAELIVAMKSGDVTAPVEADNGLNIIRLENIEMTPTPGNKKGVKRYCLKRIFLLLPQTYDVPSFADAERQMRAYAEQKAMEDFVKGLMKTIKLEYPHGKIIFDVAKNMKRMPAPIVQ